LLGRETFGLTGEESGRPRRRKKKKHERQIKQHEIRTT
jgi:hypothetical protein